MQLNINDTPKKIRSIFVWLCVIAVVSVPIVLAAGSEYLQYRSLVYIIAGFAGIIGLALLLVQPLLIGRDLPGIDASRSRIMHAWSGGLLVFMVVVHVAGLWITSPPDVIDALLFRSPTPFSLWGVIAMWAVFLSAIFALIRRPIKISPRSWRFVHGMLALVIVSGTIAHALLIEGTMEFFSKIVLCTFVGVATLKVLYDFKIWALVIRKKRGKSLGANAK
jgi:predicted ferric reductase